MGSVIPRDDSNEAGMSKYFLVPLVILVMLGLLFSMLRYRRRDQRRAAMYASGGILPDPEARGAERAIRRPVYVLWPGQSNAPRADAGGRTAGPAFENSQEGLDEFGEAPPAYTAKKPEQAAGVEMGAASAPPQVQTTLNSAPTTNLAPPPLTAQPPGYGDVVRTHDGTAEPRS
jgi:hypothetical protein